MYTKLKTPPSVEPVTLLEICQQCRLDIAGQVINSGTLTIGQYYLIVTCAANHFYTGCQAGDTFQASAATVLDANDTVQIVPEAAVLMSYELAARMYVENLCGPLITQTWDQFERHFPCEYYWWKFRSAIWNDSDTVPAMLPSGRRHHHGFTIDRPNVQSIASLEYTDSTGVVNTIDPSVYTLVKDNFRAHVVLQKGQQWPEVDLQRGDAVDIQFIAGFGDGISDIPEPIRRAILLLVSLWYERREPISERPVNQLPFAVDALLANYRWEGF